MLLIFSSYYTLEKNIQEDILTFETNSKMLFWKTVIWKKKLK